ncbi:MAG TPA: acyl-CoA carboxylase subunit beta [Myxococcales bacterium]|nr:acyl-CoA carboxylase subunit beta [Myxococcales bacterium]HIN86094.1 acyl-CoA carboxylase subunit beta [Myxococcales bacterium]
MRELVAELAEKREAVLAMGGEKRVTRQKARGKMTVRERITVLFDDDTFMEFGTNATFHIGHEEITSVQAPADGVITGIGKINGRMTACAAYDFTVLGGSIGMVGETKVTRLREMALKDRIPIVWLIDSAGARIHPAGGLNQAGTIAYFANSGYLFREQVHMSGVIPQVAAMVGPGAAGTAYIPGLADFVPMVRKTSSMALGGPALVRAAVGEEISEEALGGSRIHNEISGVADQQYKSDEECLNSIKAFLSYLPQNCREKPERLPYEEKSALLSDDILDLLPEDSKASYDMRKLIEMVVDEDSVFEIKPKFAKNLVTCFARIGGYSVGIVANNPRYVGGVLNVDAADKAARFVNLCDAYNVPLVFLQDVPGFVIGSKAEQEGIIRHGAKMLFAVADATVPKMTVVIRKAYGAGYYVMCGRAYEPDLFVSWPTGEISVMGAKGLVSIAMAKALAVAPDRDDMINQLAEHIQPHINIYNVAGHAYVDEVIDPRETRKVLIHALERTRNKTVERPWRKKGVVPV